MKIDGHIHSPFCPHGSTDSFEQYIEKAIQHGFSSITFTEHAPLPSSFIDPTPDQDSGMSLQTCIKYIETLQTLKQQYANRITIKIGLEVDYIVGYEEETRSILNTFGPQLDDSILSVHFLPLNDSYTCIDYSKDVYLQFAHAVGGAKNMYDLYYATVLQSIHADLGPYKPTRIGHPTLIHKFQLALSEQIDDEQNVKGILQAIYDAQYELDFNSAGLSKPYCKEPYPPLSYLPFIETIGLQKVFGSDAHTASDLHQHYDIVNK